MGLCFAGTLLAEMSAAAVPLLGGQAPWKFNEWRAVTDAVRGGRSTASLRFAPGDSGAEFSGLLDPSKLKAGFAGMALKASSLPKELAELRGLRVSIAKADGREYSLSLKMRGAMAGATHKFRFQPKDGDVVDMPFHEFVAISRGRPDPNAAPLDSAKVESIEVQIESHFGEQKGEYVLALDELQGLLEGEVAKEKFDMYVCRACGTANRADAETCVRCGACRATLEAEPKPESSKPAKWRCSSCDAQNFPAATEC
eukprot:CAMPEP_0178396094 /NCGR_PEP_ID=MMETSP0689_2-20121128/13555_1 /TAXON_ID=160604 /ORGANISM="Amphidinium massartii, Strain CS-259" /LENGTH=255 /DNA_ID=CAMNT_0020016765 /DNA_START=21 /DNA_END=785 /DNA_ORIENTATION=+